jgi:ectoine hydroxylase-related dioxygenase (phytanoyl-CoA dioxygenase family)
VTPAAAIRQDGYVVLRGVLDEAVIVDLRVAFDDDGSGHTEHVEITDSTRHAELWFGLAHEETFHAIVVELIGAEFQTRIHGRNPRPGGGQQGLHADLPAGRLHAIDAVTALWMLDDFTVENGATRPVPGSHREGRAVPRSLAQPLSKHADEIVMTGSAGDVLMFDSHLWHSGQRNTTASARRCVQMVCTPNVSPF